MFLKKFLDIYFAGHIFMQYFQLFISLSKVGVFMFFFLEYVWVATALQYSKYYTIHNSILLCIIFKYFKR